MNNVLANLGIDWLKPVLTALVLPPVPLLLLVLVGARTILARRGLGWLMVLVGVSALWLGSCAAVGEWLGERLLQIPAPLSPLQRTELKARIAAKQPVAIVVLGGGRESRAPEYGVANLTPYSAERLRYGLWLSRETGAPVAFSGGVGWAQNTDGPAEALIAARIAERDFNRTLRWTEELSRDTRENATRMMALLQRDGIREVVLVSHGWHLPRALRAFTQVAPGSNVSLTPAPMGLAPRVDDPVLRWMPTQEGFEQVRQVLREVLAHLVGA